MLDVPTTRKDVLNLWRRVSDLPRTSGGEELLDLGVGSSEDVRASLDDLWRINRFLVGLPAITRYLYPYLQEEHGEVSVVDLGTGSAQIALEIARWGQRNGRHLHGYG